MDPSARHYLDHASTTPLRAEAAEALRSWLDRSVAGDPARLHSEARVVRAAIEESRESVANFFGVRSRQVIFTSGGTEAVAAATWGATRLSPGVILAPAVEHSSVLASSRLFGGGSAISGSTTSGSAGQAPGTGPIPGGSGTGPVEVVPVSGEGRVDAEFIQARLVRTGAPPVALVHCQVANHEVGTLQPVDLIAESCRSTGVLCHADACAGAGHFPLDMEALGADMVSFSSHKLGGPPGIGALILRRGLRIPPLLAGSSQERNRRAGMENVPGIIGFGAALGALGIPGRLEAEATDQVGQLASIVTAALAVEGVGLVGPADPAGKLPHIACFSIQGVLGEPVLLGLEAAGIAVHSGSACSSETLEPSPVLAAMGIDSERTIRVSVGWSTGEADVSAFARTFPVVVGKLRALGG